MSFTKDPPIGLLIAYAHRRIKQAIAARLQPYGLTSQEFWVLLLVAEGAVASVQEVGRRIGVDKAAASRVVERLDQRGWVESVRAEEDHRRLVLELTAAGRRAAARMQRLAQALSRELELGLGDAEQRRGKQMLLRIIGNLDAAMASPPTRRRS